MVVNTDIDLELKEIKDFTEEELESLVDSGIEKFELFVANHLNTPVKLLERLSEHGASYVLETLATNTNIISDIQSSLYLYDNFYINSELAKNLAVTLEILELLSQSDDCTIVLLALDNPNVTRDILENLSKHKKYKIRSLVADSKRTPPDILKQLAKTMTMW